MTRPMSPLFVILTPTVSLLALSGCHSTWETVDTEPLGSDPPVVILSSPAFGSTWTSGEPIVVLGAVSDDLDAAQNLTVSITSDLEGEVAAPSPASDGSIESTLILDAGTHLLTVLATDGLGNVGSSSATIRVLEGSYPSQPAIRFSPVAPVTGQDLTAEIIVESVDPEGDALTYNWSWRLDGEDAGISDAFVPADQVYRDGVWEVTVYATDGITQSPRAVRQVTVGDAVADPSPVEITPADALPGTDLTCSHVDPVDPEGDAFTVSYAWTVNGIEAGVFEDTLVGGAERGDVVICSVIVLDDRVTAFPSPALRIGNGAPSVASVSVSPTIGDRSTIFTCGASGASDPDGDTVSLDYAWTVNGEVAGSGRTFSNAFSRDDSLACVVTPTDGYLDGAPVSSVTVTIGDAAPGAPGVEFTRTEIVPGVAATCAVTTESVDPDGDAVSYTWSWTVDGVAVSSTSDTLSTSALSVGQELTCIATPTDGTRLGSSGRASLVLGGLVTGDVQAGDAWATITGSAANGQFGKAVDTVPDLDGDGLMELVIAAPRGDGGSKGAAYLYTSSQLSVGGTFTDADATAAFYGHTSGDYLGSSRGAAGAGDLDGDGIGDFILSTPYEDTAGKDSGQAYLFYGDGSWSFGDDVLSASDARFRGETNDWLGVRMAAGDLNADGIDDLCVSAPYNDLGVEKGGVVAVYYGGTARFNGSYNLEDADARVYGTETDEELGWSLATMGDGDGDGYNDMGVGIFYADAGGTDAGQAAIISGDSLGGDESFSSAAWLVVTGTHAGDRFGYDVAGAGDVDGDGLEDVLLGGYLNDDAGADAGEAVLFYGRRGLNAERDATDADAMFFGETAGDYFGGLLAPAGDWDGDGLSDLLLGAPRGSGGGLASAGAGYLFLGSDASSWTSSTSAADASVRFLGDAASDLLADEAVGDFDVDGDGYSDVALGAQGADLGASGGGAVYLFRGP